MTSLLNSSFLLLPSRVCTIQRLYAMLRVLFFCLKNAYHRAKSCEETGCASCAFNDACRPRPLACLGFEIAMSTNLIFITIETFDFLIGLTAMPGKQALGVYNSLAVSKVHDG